MTDPDMQLGYWNSAGVTKTYGHPVLGSWFSALAPEAAILDVGCGYGRVAGILAGSGFRDVIGVDFADGLIERARAEHPGIRFQVQAAPPRLDFAAGSIDAVTLFAVLTCIPGDDAQRAVVAEIHRVLRPGGLLYVSDLCIQADARNQARYERYSEIYRNYGVFETGDGAVCRHHRIEWLRHLFGAFTQLEEREIAVSTMNGNAATATQLLLTRP